MNFFLRISNKQIFLALIFLIFFKILFLFLYNLGIVKINLGGGSDANYYHQYAIGEVDYSTSIWPDILAGLNSIGLYSRDFISYILFLLNLIIIPLLVCKITNLKFHSNQKIYLYCILVILVYPTLYFYSFDIYRDVFMVSSFLVGIFFAKKSLITNNFLFFLFYLFLAVGIGILLYKLRPYLGYAFLGSLLLWKIKFNKKRILILSFLYLIFLFIFNYLGLLDKLTEYRSNFEEDSGGSTLGLNFSNPTMFIPNFILSMLGQLFGLYITNPIAVFLFILETIPFIYMLIYIIKNINYADSFIRFLIIFFVLYGSVWLIGNDNLGTAVRLRIFNYFAVYICFFYILGSKNKLYKSRF